MNFVKSNIEKLRPDIVLIKRILSQTGLFIAPVFILAISFSIGCSESERTPAGTISAGSPEAVDAGIQILNQGGNAIDAAIAVAFALAVTEPAQSGLGGQAQFLLHMPGKEPIIINGTSFSPSRIPENIIRKDLIKHKASTVPSLVKALGFLWENHGSKTITWQDILKPAIEYAESGFLLEEFRYKVLQLKAEELGSDPVTRKLFLSDGGSIYEKSSHWKQLVLARTLKRLAENGPEDFYTGDIAKKIAEDIKNNGGWITISDLKNFPDPTAQQPLRGTYRGYEIYTMPPPGGGWVIIQALNILELHPKNELNPDSNTRIKLIAHALHLAHQSRRDNPINNLIEYKNDVMLKTSKDEARRLLHNSTGGETTHFSVADKNGMIVSATLSINNYFGSKSASPDLGFLYNDYMNEFKLNDPEHPFNLNPNAMPYSSMTPTILLKDGVPVMAIGSPGSERIISAIVQVISLWIDAGLKIEDAVAYPRIHVTPDRTTYLESNDFFKEEIANLEEAGFIFAAPPSEIIVNELNPYFGGINAVAYEDNEWRGAADPRRDGSVGYTFK